LQVINKHLRTTNLTTQLNSIKALEENNKAVALTPTNGPGLKNPDGRGSAPFMLALHISNATCLKGSLPDQVYEENLRKLAN